MRAPHVARSMIGAPVAEPAATPASARFGAPYAPSLHRRIPEFLRKSLSSARVRSISAIVRGKVLAMSVTEDVRPNERDGETSIRRPMGSRSQSREMNRPHRRLS